MTPLRRQVNSLRVMITVSGTPARRLAYAPSVPTPHSIRIARERHKFSCAHMTVFPDGTKERLHGHNYSVEVVVELDSIAFDDFLDFGPIKAGIAQICDDWKEHVMLARDNPFYEVISDDGVELEFRLCGERYVLPCGDTIVLPVDNLSVEALSHHMGELLLATVPSLVRAQAVIVTVNENPGQGASSRLVPMATPDP